MSLHHAKLPVLCWRNSWFILASFFLIACNINSSILNELFSPRNTDYDSIPIIISASPPSSASTSRASCRRTPASRARFNTVPKTVLKIVPKTVPKTLQKVQLKNSKNSNLKEWRVWDNFWDNFRDTFRDCIESRPRTVVHGEGRRGSSGGLGSGSRPLWRGHLARYHGGAHAEESRGVNLGSFLLVMVSVLKICWGAIQHAL